MQTPASKGDQALKRSPLFGQWLGKFEGKTAKDGSFVYPGSAIFNIERDSPDKGFACIDQGNQVHGSRKNFDLKILDNKITGHSTSTIVFDWKNNEIISVAESVRRQNGQVFYFDELIIDKGFIDENALNCEWRGLHQNQWLPGSFTAKRLSQGAPRPADETMSWEDFKLFVAKLIHNGDEFLFRGQASNTYQLKSSFHREHRYDLLRYDSEDCAALAQHINATSPRQYDRNNPSDFGPLLSLAQHHGFPTPLLDWSKSPYIAALFAFENRVSRAVADTNNPRIFVFDALTWQQDTSQAAHIADPRPVIAPREFPAHNNPRHLPQQSVHTYTNIEDMEAWIRLMEQENKKHYLTIIDIPRTERKYVMRDLAYMGVTAASLFPGLDGIAVR